jgi:CBS-domain-containing membrane protein
MTKTYLLRLAWIMLGSAIAISLALSLTQTSSPLLLASLGGSTLFLFGLTTTPAAQPRALFGGHILSSLIGVLAYQFFGLPCKYQSSQLS